MAVKSSMDESNIRVHFAARIIAYHAAVGYDKWSKCWVAPILSVHCPTFLFYLGEMWDSEITDASWFHPFVSALLSKWPTSKLRYFRAYPMVTLLAKHTPQERAKIFQLLRAQYGFPIKF